MSVKRLERPGRIPFARPLSQGQSRRLTASSGRDDYWNQTRRPLLSLVFLLPWLAVYEAGVLWIGGTGAPALRNGADAWMRWVLSWCGFGQLYLLPFLVLALFLTWHLLEREPRSRISSETLVGMAAESLLFAFCLTGLSWLQRIVFVPWAGQTVFSTAGVTAPDLRLLICFVGAGVYEEVLFRLLALPMSYAVLRVVGLPRPLSLIVSAVASSALFSAAHHLGPFGEPLEFVRFSFRLVAGLFFSALFVLRGFGIAVGTHALYDILVGVLGR